MRCVIIDYGSGNLRSVAKAFERVAPDVGFIAADIVVSSDPEALASADHIVLPGVGAFGDCMAGLTGVDGLKEALFEAVQTKGRPFLGICVGMQLLADKGLEHGSYNGLGWIGGTVDALKPADDSLKIPHMGWNELNVTSDHPVFDGIETGTHMYFVHSYAFDVADKNHLAATTDYGGPVTAAVAKDTMIGTQFHPEKSQKDGLHLLTNFLRWRP